MRVNELEHQSALNAYNGQQTSQLHGTNHQLNPAAHKLAMIIPGHDQETREKHSTCHPSTTSPESGSSCSSPIMATNKQPKRRGRRKGYNAVNTDSLPGMINEMIVSHINELQPKNGVRTEKQWMNQVSYNRHLLAQGMNYQKQLQMSMQASNQPRNVQQMTSLPPEPGEILQSKQRVEHVQWIGQPSGHVRPEMLEPGQIPTRYIPNTNEGRQIQHNMQISQHLRDGCDYSENDRSRVLEQRELPEQNNISGLTQISPSFVNHQPHANHTQFGGYPNQTIPIQYNHQLVSDQVSASYPLMHTANVNNHQNSSAVNNRTANPQHNQSIAIARYNFLQDSRSNQMMQARYPKVPSLPRLTSVQQEVIQSAAHQSPPVVRFPQPLMQISTNVESNVPHPNVVVSSEGSFHLQAVAQRRATVESGWINIDTSHCNPNATMNNVRISPRSDQYDPNIALNQIQFGTGVVNKNIKYHRRHKRSIVGPESVVGQPPIKVPTPIQPPVNVPAPVHPSVQVPAPILRPFKVPAQLHPSIEASKQPRVNVPTPVQDATHTAKGGDNGQMMATPRNSYHDVATSEVQYQQKMVRIVL
jgi:hypothetical protein